MIAVDTSEVWADPYCPWEDYCGEDEDDPFNLNQTLVIDTATSAVWILPKPGGGYRQARLYQENG